MHSFTAFHHQKSRNGKINQDLRIAFNESFTKSRRDIDASMFKLQSASFRSMRCV